MKSRPTVKSKSDEQVKEEYEDALKVVNGLRSMLTDVMHQYQIQMPILMRKRTAYKKRFPDAVKTWWEMDANQGTLNAGNVAPRKH